ncbi:MAG TPA: alpha/beta hydrolase [Burkholderiaceae bacterium]|nr:alpha/beta hydrolase [Burkholderiaceae bacterium]
MQSSEFTLDAADGTKLFVRRWLPDQPPRSAIQVVHGLAEHSGRYAGLAATLTGGGHAVFAADLRGHGRTAGAADLGYFADRDGWHACCDDLWQVHRAIAAEVPGIPVGIFGHSMGSFLVQQFIAAHGEALFAAALSASNGKPPAIAALGRLIARFERMRLGPRGRSPLLQQMMFGEFNRRFAPARTAFDWLSRDTAEVDAYIADPLCGFPFTVQLAIDLVDALGPLLAPANVARIPKRLPVLVLSGTADPVGSNLASLIATYRQAGLKVATRLYEGGRHEMLHETNRADVLRDILAWIDESLAVRATG